MFYTDGISEAMDERGTMLESKGLATIAAAQNSTELFGIADRILEQITLFRDGPAKDDITLIVAEIRQ